MPAQLATAVALSALGGLVLVAVGDWRLMLALLAAAVLVGLGMVRPALLVSVFVLVRPVLDAYSGTRLGGVASANPGGALGLLLLGALVVLLAGAPSFFRPRATWAFVAVLAMSAAAGVNSLLSIGPTMGAKPISELLRLSVLAAVYMLAANLFARPHAMRRLFALVGVSAVVPAAVGVYQWASGTVEVVPGSELARIGGTFTGPLPFSAYLATAGVVLISVPASALKVWVRIPALAVVLTALVGTYSREGWIIFLLGALLLHWRGRKARVIALAVAVAVVVAIVPAVQERVLPAETGGPRDVGYESYSWRIDNWSGLLGKVAERPVFGWGLETTEYVNPRAPVQGQGVPGGGYEAHNTGVRVLVEGGVVLFGLYILLFVTILRRLRQIKRSPSDVQPYARIVYWLWVVLIVISLSTDDPLEQSATMYAELALAGCIEGAYRHWLATREGGATEDEARRASVPPPKGPAGSPSKALPAGARA